jgi:predicted dienelactone hydrolase
LVAGGADRPAVGVDGFRLGNHEFLALLQALSHAVLAHQPPHELDLDQGANHGEARQHKTMTDESIVRLYNASKQTHLI